MASIKMACHIVAMENGSYSVMLGIHDLTEKEARELGDMLHDPVGKVVELATKARHTATTNFTSTRGTTQ